MMSDMRRGAIVLGLMAGLASPALAEGETAATVVATVNGAEITLGQMIAAREALPQHYLALPDAALFEGILEQLVQQETLAQSVTEKTRRDEANLVNTSRGYLASAALAAVAKEGVSEEALKKAYEARYTNAAPAKEYKARHILVDSEEKALALKAEIEGGADFAEIAKANSTDTGSGVNGGDLGWFGPGMMVKPFEDAVIAAEAGKVTAPVESQFGWHIILVEESRDATVPDFETVREDLAYEIEDGLVRTRIEELTAAAKIERPGAGIDPALLKNDGLID